MLPGTLTTKPISHPSTNTLATLCLGKIIFGNLEIENGELRITKETPNRMDFNSQFSILNSQFSVIQVFLWVARSVFI
jgi:hypothetical protein